MSFTAVLGTINSFPSNIVLGLGANTIPHNIYSGIYTLVSGKREDTLYLNINYPQVDILQVKIPDPYIQTAFVGDPQENIVHAAGFKVRVVGQGNLYSAFEALDTATIKTSAVPIAMNTISAEEPFKLINFVSQKCSLTLETINQGEFFVVNRIVIYLKPIYTMRPR